MEEQRTKRGSATRQRPAGVTDNTASELGASPGALGGMNAGVSSGSTPAGAGDPSSGSAATSPARSSGVVDRVKDGATAQLNTQKSRAAAGLDSVAQAVRQTTQQLRSEQHETVAQYIDQAADQLERFSSRMRDKDVSEILRDVQQLARRQPALFIGGSFAVGLLAARFLRSSQENESYGGREDAGGNRTQRGVGWDTDDLSAGAY